MLLVDANVLLYAVNADARHHTAARDWLRQALNADETVGIAWVAALAFLRVSTSPVALAQPLGVEDASDFLEGWLGRPQVVLLEPTPRHLPLLRSLLASVGTAGNLVNDAHLAALALEYDATVISFDRDFGRFAGVRWRLPE
ncbi:MAG: type II toxin-antitoxin system VapC family toxin [Solirubrobacteraceae bacterium]